MGKLSIINKNMSEREREEYLKNLNITIVVSDSSKTIDVISNLNLTRAQMVNKLREYGITLNIFKVYSLIGDTNLKARFSKTNLSESIAKSNNILYMPYVIFNIDEILSNSIKIEEHDDIKKTTSIKSVHELLSILKINDDYIIIKTTIKELNGKIDDSVYSISNFDIIKDGTSGYLPQINEVFHSLVAGIEVPSSINLTQLLQYVNSGAILKYIPNSLLNDKQIEIKNNEILDFKMRHYNNIK